MKHLSIVTLPLEMAIPMLPPPAPLSERLRMTTRSAAPAVILIAVPPPALMPARLPSPLIVIALVIRTDPYAPESTTEISPPAAVLEMAPAKVLQGEVRLHGKPSSPFDATHVRVWA